MVVVRQSLKHKLVAGVAVVAVAAGGGIAYAAGKSSGQNERQAFLNDVAKRLHVTPGNLQSALKGAFADRLDQLVKEGRLTRKQAQALEQHLGRRGPVPFLGPGPGRWHRGGPPPFFRGGPGPVPHPGAGGGALGAAAKYLGLTPAALRRQLFAGKSLAAIAKARHKDVAGLESAMKAATRARLDRAVAQGWLTKKQESRILQGLDARIGALVTGGLTERAPRFGGRIPWGAPPGGPARPTF
jgi:hypothetical protein